MVEVTSRFFALWHWVTINGLFVVMAINLAVLACAVSLAAHAGAVVKRLRRLAIVSERNTLLIDKLMKEVDATVEKLAVSAVRSPERDPQIAVDQSASQQIREEIEAILDQINTSASGFSFDQPADNLSMRDVIDVSFAQTARDEIQSLKAELTTEFAMGDAEPDKP